MTSRSLVLSCSFRSFTPTCTGLIVQYFSFLLAFEVRIPVTPQLVTDVLRVLRIEFPDYPSCEHLCTVSNDDLMAAFCEHPSDWGDR